MCGRHARCHRTEVRQLRQRRRTRRLLEVAARIDHHVRRLLRETEIVGKRLREKFAETASAGPGCRDRAVVTDRAHSTIREHFERHRLRRRADSLGDIGDDLAAQCFAISFGHHRRLGRRRNRGRRAVADLAMVLEQEIDQIGFAHFAVADRGVGRGRVVVRENHCAAGVGAQAVEHRREVGVAREDHELVEMGAVGEMVDHVHDHANVGRILELGSEGRAVDDLETGAQEVMSHERERVHVGGIVALIASRHRIAVAAVHHDAPLLAPDGSRRPVGRGDQGTGFDSLGPHRCITGEALRGLVVLPLQRQVDIVVVDKDGAQKRPSSFTPDHQNAPCRCARRLPCPWALFTSRDSRASCGPAPSYSTAG